MFLHNTQKNSDKHMLTWSSIVRWSFSCNHVPRIIESSAWHKLRNSEVVVFAGFSVKVNSATSICNRCVYLLYFLFSVWWVKKNSKIFGGNSDSVSYNRRRTIAAGAFSCCPYVLRIDERLWRNFIIETVPEIELVQTYSTSIVNALSIGFKNRLVMSSVRSSGQFNRKLCITDRAPARPSSVTCQVNASPRAFSDFNSFSDCGNE